MVNVVKRVVKILRLSGNRYTTVCDHTNFIYFRRNAIDSRRTIMRGMTDLLKESSFILVRIQFVRWPSWSYRCLDTLIFSFSNDCPIPFLV